MRTIAHMIITVILACAASAWAISVKDVPNPWVAHGDYVEDGGQVLGAEYAALISAISRQLKDKTTDELMVVTVDNLNGITVDDYAEQLFKQLGVGEKAKDDGVLILLSRDDRKVRIEVGYGLESILNDARAGRILDDHAVSFLHDNQFGRGLYEAAKAVAQALAMGAGTSLDIQDPATWPAQPEVRFGMPSTEGIVDKRLVPFGVAFGTMLFLVPLMAFKKTFSCLRRQTVKGRKAAITDLYGLDGIAFGLPPIVAVIVGSSEKVLIWGILAALLAIAADVGMWFVLKWLGKRAEKWCPRCTKCHKSMAFVKTTSQSLEGESGDVRKGTATDLWRCPYCRAEQKFADTIYISGRSGSSDWSYSRPSSGGRSSGGGSSGGGGASRSF